ncbi:hypothetical protein Bca4012_059647 [Brassica carinata]
MKEEEEEEEEDIDDSLKQECGSELLRGEERVRSSASVFSLSSNSVTPRGLRQCDLPWNVRVAFMICLS